MEKRFMCRDRSKLDDDGVDPDPVTVVTTLLSPRMTDRILGSGCVGARIAWV